MKPDIYFSAMVFSICTLFPAGSSAGNPVLQGADPHAMVVGDTVWVYPTHGRGVFHAFSSNDLVNWEQHGPVLRFADIEWIPEGKFPWAPGVAQRDGKFYFYYSVGPKPSHIGVAVSNSPGGAFVDSGRPLLSDNNDPRLEAIDAMVYHDPEADKWYFYAGGSAGATLRVFELNDDMMSFREELEVETPPNFTEGAFLHRHGDLYHFTYSHGYWRTSSYSVHHATGPTPLGPWTCRGAIMTSDDRHKGPGHHSIIQNRHSGDWLIFYHRWNNRKGDGPFSGVREIAIERLFHKEDGSIRVIGMTDEGVADWAVEPQRIRPDFVTP